jgi:multidrug efflux pump subunit AcrB
VVVTTIPIALLSALAWLWAAGQTINIMTLAGLALAVGVLVDEATVEIENIHTHMQTGLSRSWAVLEAASKTAVPRLLSMLCILAVFVPSFFMSGVGRQLFVPLSLAVAFAMVSSYVLSSTLVPVMSTWLMHKGTGEHREGLGDRLRRSYRRYLERVLRFRGLLVTAYLVCAVLLVVTLLSDGGD